MADLVLKNIRKSFGTHEVIKDLNLSINDGEFITLLGPSGCGKTTLLRMIAGLEEIDYGELFIGGKSMGKLPPQKRPLGMVFQSYALFPHMNVKNNIIFGLKIQKCEEHEIFDKLDWVIPLLGLDGLEERLPKEISGGQRQRVALARALVLDPEILLLDEPLSNLDAALRELAMEELKRIHQKVGKTIVYVTHNQAEAMSMSQRIAVLNKGVLEQYASPMDLYDRPATLFVSSFVGGPVANTFSGVIKVAGNDLFVNVSVGLLKMSASADTVKVSSEEDVTVAIRPQDIHLFTNQRLGAEASLFKITPFMIETPGDRTLVIAKDCEGNTVRFFINRIYDVPMDVEVEVYVASQHIHIFDSNSGHNLVGIDVV